jgi:redox-sensitive bicupin YhaK (pirin superfamily)
MNRRRLLKLLTLVCGWMIAKILFSFFNFFKKKEDSSVITQRTAIDFQWPTQEPFLFCVHHLDCYPAGNKNLGLDKKYFRGRDMGQDFELKDGFRIYHGEEIPGFPVHPHRGFETITIVRKGFVDHADSLGAAGRYGEGDVQWMTAGGGIQHCEMFPLLQKDKENTVELFQIWLNLPRENKMVPAEFKMLWSHTIPKVVMTPGGEVSIISGEYQGTSFFEAPQNSWALSPKNCVNIFLVKLEKGGNFHLPKREIKTNRSLYFFEGQGIEVNGELVQGKKALFLDSEKDLMVCSLSQGEFLFLEARPIGEPIVQHGPFVMTTKEEIYQAIDDYQHTKFGGWKWSRSDVIHGPQIEKFAKYPDGRIERPLMSQKGS